MSTSDAPPSNIRRALLACVGVAAAAGGGWWALKRQAATTGDKAAASEPLPAGFWTEHFDTIGGPPMAMASLQGRPLLINFWATWCPPCVKEMPELARFHQAFQGQGWQVLGLAVDSPTPVKEFLAKTHVGFQVGLAGFGGTELAQKLGNTAGGLPFSVMIDAKGGLRHRKMGATSFDELAAWAHGLQA
ncbi:MAG: TlpA family protein disulfide reductase [Rubrivivax sp.]|nr:MAG: TlpA family protein disulfide reductase [Rubrivivax sp.]